MAHINTIPADESDALSFNQSAFDQNLGWCVGDDVFECQAIFCPRDVYWGTTSASLPETAFSGTVCASTLCGVTQGSCPP